MLKSIFVGTYMTTHYFHFFHYRELHTATLQAVYGSNLQLEWFKHRFWDLTVLEKLYLPCVSLHVPWPTASYIMGEFAEVWQEHFGLY